MIVCINLAAFIMIAVAASSSIGSISSTAKLVTSTSKLQKVLQQADMYHDSLRAEVFAIALSSETKTLDSSEILQEFSEDSMLFRNNLETIMDLSANSGINTSTSKMIPVAQQYIAMSEQLVKHFQADKLKANDQLPDYLALFQKVKILLGKQTDLIETQTLLADRRQTEAATKGLFLIFVSVLLATSMVLLVNFLVSNSIRRSLGLLVNASRSIADGEFKCEISVHSKDELGEMSVCLSRMAVKLREMIDRLRQESRRDNFSKQIIEALEMADSETHVHETIGRAMSLITNQPMELLIADSSRANLERASQHGSQGAPGCSVDAPFNCIAVRRGNVVSFSDSEAINACPRLRGRACGSVSALCIPITFMGRSLGVLHTTGEVDKLPAPEVVEQLNTLSLHAGARIGTVRAFDKTQKLASTDSLTGLANRWSCEERISQLGRKGTPYAFAMVDLDNFKRLNDTYGHNAGDKCLRIFADILRKVLRSEDLPCRWGGEEFAILMPGATAAVALQVIERLRTELAQALGNSHSIQFTASYGVADTSMSLDFEQLALIADEALYKSKTNRRNQATVGGCIGLETPKTHKQSDQQAVINLRMLEGAA